MKFVFNEEKNAFISNVLMMTPSIEEGEAILKDDSTSAFGHLKLGIALGREGRGKEALEVFSKGIAYNPFYAPLYFSRGRRHSALGEYHAALADFTMAIQLDPSVWTYWYYRGTAENIHGDLENSISDFMKCIPLTIPAQRFVLVHWLYTTYAEMGDYKKAEESLAFVDGNAQCQKRNYGYKRSVLLYKGMVTPEEYIDEEEMKREVLPVEGRVRLEKTGMLYGLYWYNKIHGNDAAALDALNELLNNGVEGAFGYKKGLNVAKQLGII